MPNAKVIFCLVLCRFHGINIDVGSWMNQQPKRKKEKEINAHTLPDIQEGFLFYV
jgi:hypothetical protein